MPALHPIDRAVGVADQRSFARTVLAISSAVVVCCAAAVTIKVMPPTSYPAPSRSRWATRSTAVSGTAPIRRMSRSGSSAIRASSWWNLCADRSGACSNWVAGQASWFRDAETPRGDGGAAAFRLVAGGERAQASLVTTSTPVRRAAAPRCSATRATTDISTPSRPPTGPAIDGSLTPMTGARRRARSGSGGRVLLARQESHLSSGGTAGTSIAFSMSASVSLKVSG